jgi:hypothetical protein
MSSWLDRFFSRNTDNSLVIREGTAIHHETGQGVYLYADRATVLDTFYNITTCVAKYVVICESSSHPHKVETFDLTLLINRDDVAYTISARTYTHSKLVNITLEQDSSSVYVKGQLTSTAAAANDRVKVSLIRTYINSVGA